MLSSLWGRLRVARYRCDISSNSFLTWIRSTLEARSGLPTRSRWKETFGTDPENPCQALPIDSRRRSGGCRQPIQNDVVEHLVACQDALGFLLAVGRPMGVYV